MGNTNWQRVNKLESGGFVQYVKYMVFYLVHGNFIRNLLSASSGVRRKHVSAKFLIKKKHLYQYTIRKQVLGYLLFTAYTAVQNYKSNIELQIFKSYFV